MLEERSAGIILFNKINNTKFLILKYPSGHWDFIKGNIEKGETDKETAKRETFEETNINNIKIYDGFHELIEYYYYINKNKVHKTVSYYVAETEQKEVKLSFEHTDFKWLDYNSLLKLITFENSKKLLVKGNNFIMKLTKN